MIVESNMTQACRYATGFSTLPLPLIRVLSGQYITPVMGPHEVNYLSTHNAGF